MNLPIFCKTRLKKIVLIILLFPVALFSTAQHTSSKFFAEVFTGPSFPAGKFGNKKFSINPAESNPSGLAKTGISINVSAGYHFNTSFGAILSAGGSFNKQDPGSYEDYFNQTNGNNTRAVVNTNSWKILKIMAGVFYSTPVPASSKLALQTRISTGLCKTSVPEYSGVIYDQNGMPQGGFKQSKKPLPWSFCYQADIGLRCWLNKKTYALFDISYFNSNPGMKYSYNPNFPSPGPLISGKNKYNLASFNIMFGVGIKL
jgi:hypothetical protein